MKRVHKAVIDKILGLDHGEHRFRFEVQARDIELDSRDFEGRDHFESPILADVLLNKTNHLYYVKMKVFAEGIMYSFRSYW